jgi:hypothetical protein
MSSCPQAGEKPQKKQRAVERVAACAMPAKKSRDSSAVACTTAGNPFHSKEPLFGWLREPFITIRDVTFGSKVANKGSFPSFGKIVVGRSDDDSRDAVFDDDIIVEIRDVQFASGGDCGFGVHKLGDYLSIDSS